MQSIRVRERDERKEEGIQRGSTPILHPPPPPHTQVREEKVQQHPPHYSLEDIGGNKIKKGRRQCLANNT